MTYVVIVTAPEGNVLRHSTHESPQEALDAIAGEVIAPEEDPAVAYDVVNGEWEASKRKGSYWGTDPCLYFRIARHPDHERYGLVQVRT